MEICNEILRYAKTHIVSLIEHYFGTKILSALHTTSREWLIKNNMFVKAAQPFNPFVVADNERYLRNLPFIRDARIIVQKPLLYREVAE